MPKLTQQFIESEIQAPGKGQRFYRDDDIRGFAIRVTRSSKAYIFEKRVGGINRRVTIGRCSEMSLEEARTIACIMLGDAAKGRDPKTGKRINPNHDVTLREVLQKYLEVKPIRKATQRNYHYAVNKHFNDWLDNPIKSITSDMAEQRHRDLTDSPNRLGTSGHGRANNALKKLRALINFANDRYGTEEEPLFKKNPVDRLSKERRWHKIYPRQNIIPDHKLKVWYRAVYTLQNEVARDFLIFLLLTGMRFGETSQLKWCHVDFENSMLIVPRELTKGDREHRLPLSDFLMTLIRKRFAYRNGSEWIFQSTRLRNKPISGGVGTLRRVRSKSGIKFTFHDLRRTFLTMGEKLKVSHYGLKKLVNHSVSYDMTGGYINLDIENVRSYMNQISERFLELFEMNTQDVREWSPAIESMPTAVTQLIIPLPEFVLV
ncbi:MAG: integrase family protein [Candidatus Obscuribacterales bacterium]|nr:integrase family protein [Candidatus Obscuribacterales bacterium]